ncbi:MAG: glycosyltransferase [Armatimonadota bacterium]
MQASLTVIVPNYNDGRYLEGKVASLLAQRYAPLEILLIDDGSTDDSLAILERLAGQHPGVRVLHNARNQGTILTVKRGLEESTGAYVLFSSANDVIAPGLLEQTMALMNAYPRAGISFTDYAIQRQDGTVEVDHFGFGDGPGYLPPAALLRHIRRRRIFYIPAASSVWQRAALLEAGGNRPELQWHCDWFAALVIAFRHGACYLPEVLMTIDDSPASYSARGTRDPAAQRQVTRALFAALAEPAQADVRRAFRAPALWTQFGPRILGEMLRHPRAWGFLSPRLVANIAWPPGTPRRWSHALRSLLPAALRKRIKHAFGRMKAER